MEKAWSELRAQLKAVANCDSIAARNYFELDGCTVYVKCFLGFGGKTVVFISNIQASEPGTGQFHRMIVKLEREARELKYTELRFETITNVGFLQMLQRNGYSCSCQNDGVNIWDGVAVKQLQPKNEVSHRWEPAEITAAKFLSAMGQLDTQDDLERCNCPKQGTDGHSDCGWNWKQNGPVYSFGGDSTCFNLSQSFTDSLVTVVREHGHDQSNAAITMKILKKRPCVSQAELWFNVLASFSVLDDGHFKL